MKIHLLRDYQKKELLRLVSFEQHKVHNSELKFAQYAFPYLPRNATQNELIKLGALKVVKLVDKKGVETKLVAISMSAYEFAFAEMQRKEDKIASQKRYNALIAIACSMSVLGTVMGFLLGLSF